MWASAHPFDRTQESHNDIELRGFPVTANNRVFLFRHKCNLLLIPPLQHVVNHWLIVWAEVCIAWINLAFCLFQLAPQIFSAIFFLARLGRERLHTFQVSVVDIRTVVPKHAGMFLLL